MSKIPEMPEFLKKELEKTNSTVSFPINKPPVPTEESVTPPPVPAEATSEKTVKTEQKAMEKTNSKNSIFFNIKNNLKEIGTWGLIILLSLTSGYYYFESEHYREKYQAIDTRVLNLTKEIASLNQENNNLSGKIVYLQKEIDNSKQIETNAESMQQALVELENKNKDLQLELSNLQSSTTKVENKKALPAPVIKAKEEVKKATPSPAKVENVVKSSGEDPKVSALSDHLVNYEATMKSPAQMACLKYFRDETLKRCVNKNNQFSKLNLARKDIEINGQKVPKLLYKCESNVAGVKGLFFRYGPLEMKQTCSAAK